MSVTAQSEPGVRLEIELIQHDTPDRYQGWLVRSGDRWADGLTWDEMLGLVASITMPRSPCTKCAEPQTGKGGCIHYLKTQAEHDAFKKRLETVRERREA